MRRPAQEMSKSSGEGSEKPSSSQQQQKAHHHHHQQPHHHHKEGAKSDGDGHGDGVTSEFQCKLYFANTLPLGVSEGKLLDIPLNPRDWLVEYRTTALEAKFKHDIYPHSSLLSMPLAFVDPQSYTPAPQRKRDSDTRMSDGDKSEGRSMGDDGSEGVESPVKRRRRDKEDDKARSKKNRGGDMNGEEDDLFNAETERLRTPEGLADAIEEGFAAAQEYSEKEPRKLQHPTKPGVFALDVTPILPCVAMEGLQIIPLHFDRDPLDNLSTSFAHNASQKKRELANHALITRVSGADTNQQLLAVVIKDPPMPVEETDDGKKLVPYGTVRLFRAKKHQDPAECPENPTKTERSVALLARNDESTGGTSFEYFDIGDIIMLSRVSDGSIIKSVLGAQGQHSFFVEEQPVPSEITEEHNEALAELYATAEQR